MPKIFCLVYFLVTFASSVYATELQTLNGRTHDVNTCVNASVVDLKLGPEMPIKIFNALDDVIKKKYSSAQYRLVFTKAEIYSILSVDLLAIWEEGEGDRVVTGSYFFPLDGYINMEFKKWNSYNNFDLILETLNNKKVVNITILPNGKFTMKEY